MVVHNLELSYSIEIILTLDPIVQIAQLLIYSFVYLLF